MKKLSKVICLVLSALMLLSLAACGKQAGGADDAQGKPIEGGTFVYAIEEPITSLNWYNNSSTDLGKQVFQNLYDPMWKSNTDGSLDYRLAKSVDISEDGTTYTLTLRDDIYWSDGEKSSAPMRSRAIPSSCSRSAGPPTCSRRLWAPCMSCLPTASRGYPPLRY